MKSDDLERRISAGSPGIDTLFFDIDDTLFDRERAQRETVGLIIQEFSHIFSNVEPNTIVDAFLESDRIATSEFNAGASGDVARIVRSRSFLQLLGLCEDYAPSITTYYQRTYPRINAAVRHAIPVVNHLARKFQLGVISNGLPDVQYQKLETLGIKHLFDCIILSEEIGIRKPDSRIFWKAATLSNRHPQNCLYIGDTYNTDVIGAKNAGMKACWYNPRGECVPQREVEPDFEIGSLDELLTVLGQQGM